MDFMLPSEYSCARQSSAVSRGNSEVHTVPKLGGAREAVMTVAADADRRVGGLGVVVAEKFRIAIVGSGPAGLSAAAHAAPRGISHVLLEKTDHLSDTIYRYQKGKHVMATPGLLVLRSDCEFGAGKRESGARPSGTPTPPRPGSTSATTPRPRRSPATRATSRSR